MFERATGPGTKLPNNGLILLKTGAETSGLSLLSAAKARRLNKCSVSEEDESDGEENEEEMDQENEEDESMDDSDQEIICADTDEAILHSFSHGSDTDAVPIL